MVEHCSEFERHRPIDERGKLYMNRIVKKKISLNSLKKTSEKQRHGENLKSSEMQGINLRMIIGLTTNF